jgi:hypothetical protein
MSPDLERAAHDELVLLVAAGLACAMVALGARAVPVRRETREGLAIGVVLAFVVELVPRLTANTTVGLAAVIRAMDEPELRRQLATNGPVVIQNAATALLPRRDQALTRATHQ